MGSDIAALMKIQLCEELRLGAVFHRQSSNRDALTYFASVALVAALFGFLTPWPRWVLPIRFL